jgi:hypothetical protein
MIEKLSKAPLVALWKQGAKVIGNTSLMPGTAIAAGWINGKYPNLPKNNHAALYISQHGDVLVVVEQYIPLTRIQQRSVNHHPRPVPNPANESYDYYVIET